MITIAENNPVRISAASERRDKKELMMSKRGAVGFCSASKIKEVKTNKYIPSKVRGIQCAFAMTRSCTMHVKAINTPNIPR
jgi:hypothetical protein